MTMLVLGVGGYEFPDRGGGDLKAFREYFPSGNIYGVDLYDKSKISFPTRIKTFKGSQADGDFLTEVLRETGIPDVIIDDASHINSLTIQSFKHLFPWLRPGGIYVIEDIESSWWSDHGFDGDPMAGEFNSSTTINFCRALTNDVNWKHIPQNGTWKKSADIDSIHFYQNMVVIIKK